MTNRTRMPLFNRPYASISILIAGSLASIPVIALAQDAPGVETQIFGPTLEDRGFSLFDAIVPVENPITEEKRILGKLLFWEEQLSSDNTMSCGTCHISTAGGGDPRHGRHPGFDGLFDTADDASGSPGVIRMDSNEEYLESVLFKLLPQVGNRVSFSNLMSPYAFNLFWDGRAEGAFHDPLTDEVVIQTAGMLEIQALGPILNSIELAHEGRSWEQVTTKLESARPLALASAIPPDMQSAIENDASYADLFEDAFGDPAITPVRIAMAIATYERTTIPNETPWDQFIAGDSNAMTPAQIEGFNAFSVSGCLFCHPAPIFSNNVFSSDGVRPVNEDLGRGAISGNHGDRGKFRSPSLRNMGLRDRMMHNGSLTNVDEIFDFYGHRNGFQPDPENLAPQLNNPILFSPQSESDVKDFLINGLTDPRVAAGVFPFDRPELYSEQTLANPSLIENTGRAGSGGFMPEPIAVTPPLIGSSEFKIGVKNALGGSVGWVRVSLNPAALNGEMLNGELVGPFPMNGSGLGNGYATFPFPLADDPRYEGSARYFQWRVNDPGATGGVALSPIVAIDPFCSMSTPCPDYCEADFTNDEIVDVFDVFAFIEKFNEEDGFADLDHNGVIDIFDVFDFVEAFNTPCAL